MSITQRDSGRGGPLSSAAGTPDTGVAELRSMFADPRVVVGLMVGLAVRIIWLGRQAWFVDEAAEFDIVSGSFRSVTTSHDGFPPLTSYVLKIWVAVFGRDSARLIPLAAGIATLLLLVVIAEHLWGRRAAVSSAWLAALSPTLVWTSQEVRPYGEFVLVTAVAVWLTVRVIDHPTAGRHLALGIGFGLGCWVHYFFPFPAGLLLVWAASSTWSLPGFTRRAAFTLVPLMVFALPAGALVLDDLSFQQGFSETSAVGSGVTEVGYSSVSLLTGATVGPGLRALHGMPAGEAVRGMAPWLALLVPAMVLTLVQLWRSRRSDRSALALAGIAIGGIGVIAAATLVAGTGYRPRYIVWATVPTLLVLARVLSTAPRRYAAVAGAALLVVFVSAIYNRNYSDEHRVEAVDEALADIDASAHPDAPVLTVPGIELVVKLYRDDPATFIPSYSVPDDLPRIMESVMAASGEGPAWIVYTRAFDHDRNGVVRDALLRRGAVPYSEHAGVELLFFDGADE